MGLLFNEEEIVQNIMGQLAPLLNTLIICILACTFTYILREYSKHKRERKLHAEQMRQLQRGGKE